MIMHKVKQQLSVKREEIYLKNYHEGET